MTALSNGELHLPYGESLVAQFQELTQILQALANQELPTIIAELLPPNVEGCRVLREAAVLAAPTCEDASGLFRALRTTVTQPEMPEEGNFVRIMSLHKSKGLTSRAVIVAGCIRGLIPFEDLKEPPAEQAQILLEQRRLFYVAITRCTELLVLSSALRLQRNFAFDIGAHVRGWSDPVPTITSQFIAELGPGAPQPRTGAQWRAAGYI